MTDPDAGRRGTASFLTPAAAANAPAWQPAPHAVYQAVLRGFASTGRPPEPAELQEAAERQHAVAAALASVRAEGLEPSAEDLVLFAEVAAGRLSTDELRERVLSRYRR